MKNLAGNWSSVLNKIGAKPSTKELAPVALISKSTLSMRKQKTITLKDAPREWRDFQVFLDEQSFPFVLYISDQKFKFISNQKFKFFFSFKEYKFHFKWCKTLEEMSNKGRSDRYRAKYDICNPLFNINDETSTKQLRVCKNCCNEFPEVYSLFNSKSNNIESTFKMSVFFNKFGKVNLSKSTHPGGKDDYNRDWTKYSTKIKEEAAWQCNDCRGNYKNNRSKLHVHHKNGVKSDNIRNNLEVVCYACHAKKPGHEHM